jgi:magnesium-transporting ATPase (P-type)
LFSVRPFHIKDVLRVLVGIVTPIFIVASIYFLTDQSENLGNAISHQFKLPLLSLSLFTKQHVISLLLITIWLVLSGLFVVAIPFSITMQTRKMIGVLIIETVLCILFIFFPTHFSIAYLLLISPLIAIFLAILLSEMKNDLVANVIFGLLIVSTFSVIIFN